jgi:hypothetical protein
MLFLAVTTGVWDTAIGAQALYHTTIGTAQHSAWL